MGTLSAMSEQGVRFVPRGGGRVCKARLRTHNGDGVEGCLGAAPRRLAPAGRTFGASNPPTGLRGLSKQEHKRPLTIDFS